MADVSEVTSAIAALAASAIYPLGNGSQSASGYTTTIAPGWPVPADLDAILGAGAVYVSVYPEATFKDTTRFGRLWTSSVVVTPTVTITPAKQLLTIGGAVTIGHYVSAVVLNVAASYAAQLGDTLATVATAIAAQLTAGGVSASAVGPAISVLRADVPDMAVASGAPGTAIMEVARQQQAFLTTIWAPSHAARVAAALLLTPLFSSTDWLGPFADTTQGKLTQRQIRLDDSGAARNEYRLDLSFWVEYATTVSEVAYPITIFAGQTSVADGTAQGATYTQNAG